PSCLYTPQRQFSQLAGERAPAPPVFASGLKPNLIRAWLTPRGMTNSAASGAGTSLREQVKTAVLWRSGGQIAAQVVAWSSTLMVIRILDPADYGVFAMTQVVLAFLSFLNGYGFASALVRDREVDPHKVRQAFGLLLIV